MAPNNTKKPSPKPPPSPPLTPGFSFTRMLLWVLVATGLVVAGGFALGLFTVAGNVAGNFFTTLQEAVPAAVQEETPPPTAVKDSSLPLPNNARPSVVPPVLAKAPATNLSAQTVPTQTMPTQMLPIVQQEQKVQAGQIARLSQRLQQLENGTPRSDFAAALALANITQVALSGREYGEQLSLLRRAFGEDVNITALARHAATGVATPVMLLAMLRDLEPALLNLASPSPPTGYLARLRHGILQAFYVRRVNNFPPDSLHYHLATVKNFLLHDDLTSALAQLDAMDLPAQDILKPWRAKVRARHNVLQALANLNGQLADKLLPAEGFKESKTP